MHALLLVLLLAQQPPAPTESPFANDVSQRLYEKLERRLVWKDDFDPLVEEARELVRREPESALAWWTSGFTLREQGIGNPKYLTRALALGLTGERRTRAQFALAALMSATTGEEAQADHWLEEALRTGWDNPRALHEGVAYLLQVNDGARAQRVLERLEELPRVGPPLFDKYARVLARQGFAEAAGKQAALAIEDGARDVDLYQLRRRGAFLGLKRRVLWLFGGQVLVLSLSLGGLYLAGTLLSRVQVQRLAAVDARLLRKQQTPEERRVDRLYNAVLWAASLIFYAFAFSVVGLSLYAAWSCVTAFSWTSLAVLALNAWASWGLLRLLLRGEEWEYSRRPLTEAEAPRLFTALEEVARGAGLPPVDRVYVSAGVSISVAEEGGTWRVMTGQGRRVLMLGFAALRELSISELKSILAHEHGHFSHGETRLTPVVHRILPWVAHTLGAMARGGRMRYFNPWYGFLNAYFFVFLRVSQGHSRRRELLADRSAALAYGGTTFGTALTQVVRNADLFERRAGQTLMVLRRTRRPCQDLYRCLNAADALTPGELRTLRTKALTVREADAYDSHPPPQERIQRVAGIRGQKGLETAAALTLFEAPELLAQEFTEELCTDLLAHLREEELGEPPPLRTDVGPEAQEQFASALSLFQDAMELRERKHPEADATVLDATRLVEASSDPDEPLLVSVLQEAAGAYHRRGDTVAAVASLLRARAVVEAHEDPGDKAETLQKIDQQLAHVRLSTYEPLRGVPGRRA